MSAEATQAGDNAELEDLFDSIAAAPKTPTMQALAQTPPATVTPLRPVAAASAGTSADADNDELEDLFDSIAMAKLTPAQEAASDMTQPLAAVAARASGVTADIDHDPASCPASKVINSVGHLTRQLHDTLAELGYDRHLQDAAAAALPDARQRIAYVVTLTEQAASRSLNAVELATPIQESLASGAESLAANWDRVFRGESDVAQFKALAESTRDYLKGVSAQTQTTRAHLREVMMAQEFQDLTGQVLKRITDLANNLENQLLKLLVENSPMPVKNSEALGLLNGPQIDGKAPDVVANQAQVDELLESLGF
jgi:chemotaxis protein CheZ